MSWIAAYGHETGLRRLGPHPLPERIERGTLVMEIDSAGLAARPEPLLHLASRRDEPRLFAIDRLADGRLRLVQRQGRARAVFSVGTDPAEAAGRLRLTFHWDTGARKALLTAEDPVTGTIRQQAGEAPLALDAEAVRALLGAAPGCSRHPALDWLAVAAGYVPLAVGPGLAADTPVDTPAGPRPASSLRAGDTVLTADAGPQVLRWSGRMVLPALGAWRPVRLLAPYFGRRTDLIVLPHHRIALSGPQIEYMAGEEEVLVEARHLVNGPGAVWDDSAATRAWQGLLLDAHQLLLSDGCRVESLFAGALARDPALVATTALGALAAGGEMPRHRRPVRRDLQAYEVRALQTLRRQARAALTA